MPRIGPSTHVRGARVAEAPDQHVVEAVRVDVTGAADRPSEEAAARALQDPGGFVLGHQIEARRDRTLEDERLALVARRPGTARAEVRIPVAVEIAEVGDVPADLIVAARPVEAGVRVRERDVGDGTAVVDGPVAVVVDRVLAVLGRVRIDDRVGIVAVRGARDVAGRDTVTEVLSRIRGVAVLIAVVVEVVERLSERTLRIRDVARPVAILVLVERVADLVRAGVHRTVRVVAIGAERRETGSFEARFDGGAVVAVPVLVRVDEPGADVGEPRVGLVDVAVAVLVDADEIAHLVCVGMDRRVVIVAVAAAGHVAVGHRAGGGDVELAPESVEVRVAVEAREQVVVDGAVAVVVEAVARLGRSRMDVGVAVVAVVVREHAVEIDVERTLDAGVAGVVRLRIAVLPVVASDEREGETGQYETNHLFCSCGRRNTARVPRGPAV